MSGIPLVYKFAMLKDGITIASLHEREVGNYVVDCITVMTGQWVRNRASKQEQSDSFVTEVAQVSQQLVERILNAEKGGPFVLHIALKSGVELEFSASDDVTRVEIN